MSNLEYARNMTDKIKGHNVYCAKNMINLGIAIRLILAGENKIVEFKDFEDKIDSRLLDNIIIDYDDVDPLFENRRKYKWEILKPELFSTLLNYDTKSYDVAYSVDYLLDLYTTPTVMLGEMTNNFDVKYIEEEWLQSLWNSSSILFSSSISLLASMLSVSVSDEELLASGHRTVFEEYKIVVDEDYRFKDNKICIYHINNRTIIFFSIKIDSADWDRMLEKVKGS